MIRKHVSHIVIFILLVAASLGAMAQQVPITQITGLVRDSVTREGIPYASISLVGTSEGTLANDKGGFTINSRSSFSRRSSLDRVA